MRREESDPQSLKTTMFLYTPCTVSVNIMTTRVPVTSNYEGVGGLHVAVLRSRWRGMMG
jgi:hypothetical protein